MAIPGASHIQFPVMEHFFTIQGEGFNAGKAAYFIRLGGCDVGCPWCDVKESWTTEGHKVQSIETLLELIADTPAKNVVITGGEPCMYNLESLTKALKGAGYNTWLETSGAYAITGDWDWIVVSPKRRKEALKDSLQKAHELKVVVVRSPDYKWAESFVPFTNKEAKFYLQPEWSREDEVLPGLINHVKSNGFWQISLQTHKYMRIP